MGNQLAGTAPSQIFPVEHYIEEFADLVYDISLGSTRFFKVARVQSKQGLAVVKVFVIHDPTLPLSRHKDYLETIRTQLNATHNILPFQKALLTDKAALLVRQYIKSSCYDRISTRPFLTLLEKKWIAFQLLQALHESHSRGICHGDIKLENIMLTSWLWVLLTDFASFKPTCLPDDNPADFAYFFDTSRRRTCYIAPERFKSTLHLEIAAQSQSLVADEDFIVGELTPEMDIFSAGCCLVELFTEGHPPFDFAQLSAYRAGEYSPEAVLEKIDNSLIQEMLRKMLSKDVNERGLAEDYLIQYRDTLFPDYFYTFLRPYLQAFSASPPLRADEKITKMHKDISHILECLTEKDPENNGIILITNIVTSSLRALHYCSSKLRSLELLLELTNALPDDIVLDRILPYIMHFLGDKYPQVRALALHVLSACLSHMTQVPRTDTHVFLEYVLPQLSQLTQDDSVLVRMTLAEEIASLAENALRFLYISHENWLKTAASPTTPSAQVTDVLSVSGEIRALVQAFQPILSALLTDSDSSVRRTLAKQGIHRLCVFLGRQNAHDVILSHLITFLNDKHDRHLRSAFYECIVGVAAFSGWPCITIIKPLLLQGLSDPEEWVTVRAINAMMHLTELGLVQKVDLYDWILECVPFLRHPNRWIRQSCVGLVRSAAQVLSPVEVQCRLASILEEYLQYTVLQLDKEVLILEALKSPIPRSIYDNVLKCMELPLLLEAFHKRKELRNQGKEGLPNVVEVSGPLKNLFRRLTAEGITPDVEDLFVALADNLLKLQRHKQALEQSPVDNNSTVHLWDSLKRVSDLKDLIPHQSDVIVRRPVKAKPKRPVSCESPLMNEEWHHMFGSANPEVENQDDKPPAVLETDAALPALEIETLNRGARNTVFEPDCIPSCRTNLQELLCRRAVRESEATLQRIAAQAGWAGRQMIPPPSWRPKGILVAHTQEHKGPVTRIGTLGETGFFASGSTDGTVKVWDATRFEGRNIANRSRQMYNRFGGPVMALTACQGSVSLAAASENGALHVVRVDGGNNKMTLLYNRQLDLQEEGPVVDLVHYDSGNESVLLYGTVLGALVGWDLRCPGNAFKYDHNLKLGVITSLCIDPGLCWLGVGTSQGTAICWDLRFGLPVTTLHHPTGARIRRLSCHPTRNSCLISAVQGNNEVSFWNLESQDRNSALWASPAPPLSQTQTSQHSVCGIAVGPEPSSPFLITGGTDRKLRFWDLFNPANSKIFATAASDSTTLISATYKSRLVDGLEVVQEVMTKPRPLSSGGGVNDEIPRPGPEPPSAGHADIISDVALVQASQPLVVSASRDGVIKVWK